MLVGQYIFSIIAVLLAFPIGIIIARGTREELKAGRKSFRIILLLSLIAAVLPLFFKIRLADKSLVVSSMLFVFIIFLILYKSSFKTKKGRKK